MHSSSAQQNNTLKHRQVLPLLDICISGVKLVSAYEANSFTERLLGLHAHPPLQEHEGLLLHRCNAIHTLTMRKAIDVVFIDSGGLVLQHATVKPLRTRSCASACCVLELSAGAAERLGVVEGCHLTRSSGCWS